MNTAVKYPLSVEHDAGNIFVHIRDGSKRVIASGLIGRDAYQIVEAFNKLWATTDPDVEMSSSFVGTCAVCGEPEPYTYHVPESLWRKVISNNLWNEIVCAKCFHSLAREYNKSKSNA